RCADVGRAGDDAPRRRRLSTRRAQGHAAHDRICVISGVITTRHMLSIMNASLFLTRRSFALVAAAVCAPPLVANPAMAQTAPSASETTAYAGLHRAALGDAAQIRKLLGNGADPNARDGAGRTPLHVAAFGSHDDAVRARVAGGGDI